MGNSNQALAPKFFKLAWNPFFFCIGNKTFIEKIEHYVHKGEHSEQETNTTNSRTKANRL